MTLRCTTLQVRDWLESLGLDGATVPTVKLQISRLDFWREAFRGVLRNLVATPPTVTPDSKEKQQQQQHPDNNSNGGSGGGGGGPADIRRALLAQLAAGIRNSTTIGKEVEEGDGDGDFGRGGLFFRIMEASDSDHVAMRDVRTI